ncbi:helix-turn-helix transcriptional regulator [Magnetospirillum sp. 15-1]|uniref:response regulator transcription factor n=1 Tax=Magnetospirillum sp. 15-1 TaxID=1979370 RepID=UPI000BBC45FC|nr:helix-turn-helix transcriptional regulator [Magnetospirillum sp. 15-1]
MTDSSSTPSLSPREKQCLFHLARGLRVDAVAEAMGTTSKTVEKQITSARAKLGAATREQAIAIAIRNNLLSGEEG